MAEETILKVLCGNHGSMDYERLLDISYGLKEISAENSLDQIIQRSDIFTVIQRDESKEVFAQTSVKLCRKSECDELCENLHLCKYLLMTGRCSRNGCSYGHQLMSKHNKRILKAHQMIRLSREDLCVILLQSDNGLLPPVCLAYNRGRGPRGNCSDGEKCARLHLCESFVRGRCGDANCCRSHDFHEPQTRKVLRIRGVSNQLMQSLPFIYRNILTLKTPKTQPHRRNTDVKPQRSSDGESEICLSFVRGFCGADKCSRTHCKMPYKWEVKAGHTWQDLPNSEQIEQDYCDPSNIHSSGKEPVCFEEMTLGLDEVRRLSTQSSVLLPGFALTTCWSWYWKNEYNRWIQYASIAEMHQLSSVSSEQLELRYQQDLEDATVKFRVGNRFYELRFTDMKQRNEVSGRERPVRRRPVFVSSVDVQIARASCCSAIKTRFSKGVPGFWDQTAIPDFGFQRVRLWPSHRDYMRVHERFSQTLRGFTIRQIERVQNRELWEDFMIKKERMKITNKLEKHGERLLFHTIESSLVEAACLRNVDFEALDAAVYGQGIYFSKDAGYWNERVEGSAVRRMFVCRVLVGYYTRGAAHFRHPPARSTDGSLYDSCVDNPREPSVFVVFDRCQIYPEFLITYEDSDACLSSGGAQVDSEETGQPAKATETGRSSLVTGSSSPARRGSAERISTALPVSAKRISTALPVSAKRISTALPVSAKRISTALPVSSESDSNAFPVSTKRISTALPVSSDSALNAFPVSAKCISTALPVSTESALNAFPVSTKRISSALPVSSESASNAFPVSTKHISSALPVSSESASNAFPVSTKRISTALPVSTESDSNAFPVSAKRISTALPVSSESASNAFPVSTKRISSALPVSSESDSNAFPVSTKRISTALPVSSESDSNAFPVSTKRISTALPVSSDSALNAFPVSTKCISTALPVSSESASNAFPVSSKHNTTRLPVSAESASNAFPVSTKRISSALPVSSESALNAFPVSTKRISSALPVSAQSDSNAFPVSAEHIPIALPVSYGSRMSVSPFRSASERSSSASVESRSRSSGSVSSSSALSSHRAGNSSADAGRNPHQPAAQKKSCAVM